MHYQMERRRREAEHLDGVKTKGDDVVGRDRDKMDNFRKTAVLNPQEVKCAARGEERSEGNEKMWKSSNGAGGKK